MRALSVFAAASACAAAAPARADPGVGVETRASARAALTAPPRPAAPVPAAPGAATRALATATDQLYAALAGNRRNAAVLWALYQQRIYLALGLDPALARAVVARVPARLRPLVRDVVTARRALVRLTPPTTRPLSSFRTGPAEPAERLLAYYREAQRRFGVAWEVLAAINFVETGFNKIRSSSSAGAQGPMQFMPATWRAYGLGGDVHDPHDAILGAANYLRASGAASRPCRREFDQPRAGKCIDYRRALYAYNHSTLYVDAVLAYARQMKRGSRACGRDLDNAPTGKCGLRAFHGFYNWQVFVRTRSGYRRLTGPGLR